MICMWLLNEHCRLWQINLKNKYGVIFTNLKFYLNCLDVEDEVKSRLSPNPQMSKIFPEMSFSSDVPYLLALK